ncbi:hypothetical protein AC579_4 [Pseudocercospora musae]|uniref:Uncharacterized protein n=1 Tax=Pseudocercospora musae TaxID=113226 RepID=A0A139I896_9PEZI|nr:hypothetical protein AC579_4 [Pseudocercospora musae]
MLLALSLIWATDLTSGPQGVHSNQMIIQTKPYKSSQPSGVYVKTSQRSASTFLSTPHVPISKRSRLQDLNLPAKIADLEHRFLYRDFGSEEQYVCKTEL